MFRIVAFIFVVIVNLAFVGIRLRRGTPFLDRARDRVFKNIEARYHVAIKNVLNRSGFRRSRKVVGASSRWTAFKVEILINLTDDLVLVGPLLIHGLLTLAFAWWLTQSR